MAPKSRKQAKAPTPSLPAAVQFDNVRLTLPSRAGPVAILRGVSLTIDEGEAVAVVGPSGSGKTTLMMVAAGLERATSGQIQVAGEELEGLNEDALALLRARNIGIVFQSFHLVPSMTALENVSLPLEFLGDSAPLERARQALDDVGLSHREDHFPAQLSGGEQQRVSIARAFVNRPLILLADEPTGNLDPGTTVGIMRLLDRINKSGTTVVMATHDQRIVDAMRRRVVELDRGAVVRDQARGVYGASA